LRAGLPRLRCWFMESRFFVKLEASSHENTNLLAARVLGLGGLVSACCIVASGSLRLYRLHGR
jgi:hypothetical protein